MLLYQLMLKIIHVEGSCVICLFHCVMTRLDYMSNMTGVLYKAGAASHLQAPGFTQVVLVGSVFLIFLVFCVRDTGNVGHTTHRTKTIQRHW
jgi:hypothetical protein